MDEEYDYPFAVEGLCNLHEALVMLKCSRSHFIRHREKMKIRSGSESITHRYCIRSIREAIVRMERKS